MEKVQNQDLIMVQNTGKIMRKSCGINNRLRNQMKKMCQNKNNSDIKISMYGPEYSTKFYSIFYKSHGKWTGPYAGKLYTNFDEAEKEAKYLAVILKSKTEVRKEYWVPVIDNRTDCVEIIANVDDVNKEELYSLYTNLTGNTNCCNKTCKCSCSSKFIPEIEHDLTY